MKCLRCGAEMKQCRVDNGNNLNIYEIIHKPISLHTYKDSKVPHNPRSAFVCEKCGYIELSLRDYFK